MTNRSEAIYRIAGYLLFARAAIFFMGALMIAFQRGMAVPSTINEVVGAIVFALIYAVYAAIVGMLLAGVFIGSRTSIFRNRLDRLTYSNYKNGSEYLKRREEKAGTTKLDAEKLETALKNKPQSDFPMTNSLNPRMVLVILLLDLVMAVVLILTLPGLLLIYVDIAVEAIAIMTAFKAIFDAESK